MQDRHIRALAQLKKGTVIPANPLCLDKTAGLIQRDNGC